MPVPQPSSRAADQQFDADAITGQFSASITGVVYHWLATPHDLIGTKYLHDQLIYTMTLYMRQGNSL